MKCSESEVHMKKGRILTFSTLSHILLALLFQLTACSDNEFSQKPPDLVVQDISASKVDIVFIDDNSGSMYVEQVKMARSFPALRQGLELNGLDYRIAIITTDVVSADNPKKELNGLPAGALQDGRFIAFPDGNLFLDKNSRDIERQFRNTIQRKETLDCEDDNFDAAKCPSGDERGIYAANLAIRRNEADFFRPGSHIAFIFLTDEDVRGYALKNPDKYKPLAGDYPETLVRSVYEILGPSHTMSSHAVVVQNETCRDAQLFQTNRPDILARIGTFYMSLSDPNSTSRRDNSKQLKDYAPGKLLKGTVGSICASNYTAQIGSILKILKQDADKYVSRADLDCEPLDDTFKVEKCPSGVKCSLAKNNLAVTFSPKLNPNQSARVSYLCYK